MGTIGASAATDAARALCDEASGARATSDATATCDEAMDATSDEAMDATSDEASDATSDEALVATDASGHCANARSLRPASSSSSRAWKTFVEDVLEVRYREGTGDGSRQVNRFVPHPSRMWSAALTRLSPSRRLSRDLQDF